MSDNPYQPPQTTSHAVGVLSGDRNDLKSIAQSQKGILVCILLYLLAIVAQFLIPPELGLLVSLGVLLLGLVGAVFVFMLSIKIYGNGLGILFGILSLIPCIGLIVLLVVNGKATSILTQNGIKVGLLGANLSTMQ